MSDKIYLLLADGDGTIHSHLEPFGVAVKTKVEAKRFKKEGNVGYSHSYVSIRLFDKFEEGVKWKFKGEEK